VSCIVPCFNGAPYLAETLDSILAQTYRHLEVIVVDDGSTDDSAEIVRRYGNDVRYHRRANGGPAAAYNTGIELATGDLIAFLEQDDLWLPDKTRRQLAEFEANTALRYCVGHIQNFWIPELEEEAERHRDLPVMQPVPGYVVQTLIAHPAAFETVGRFDESLRYASASDWFLRAADANAAGVLIPDVVTRRRLHESNFSRVNRTESRAQFLRVVKSTLDRRRAGKPA
jgi:glycosyltransferase involved in cell wall biosynthesis